MKERRLFVRSSTQPIESKDSVASRVARELDSSSPAAWLWFEPDPLQLRPDGSLGRVVECALVPGDAAPDPSIPLVEARLFWPRRALHLVALAAGLGCCEIREVEDTAVEIRKVETGDGSSPEFKEWIGAKRQRPYTVQIRKDWQRFKFEKNPVGTEELRVVEWFVRAVRVTWRVLVEGEE